MSDKLKDLVVNRRARHDYEILETYETGIVLQGTEVKSLRDNGGSLAEAYCKVLTDELWLVACSIAPYRFGNIHNHEEKRQRKLLMHKNEIEKLRRAMQEKGLTVVPLSMYLNKRGRVKVSIGLARGKKLHDKRSAIKERDEKRAMQRTLKQDRD
ncbi:MAG: SsrA-binding protein SmpB [Chlamydiia bacterium]|nr:SsrA-binding protein SmpB [Chlamydiia bacterium]